MNIAEELNRSLEKEPVTETKDQKEKRKERKKQIKQLKGHADKLGKYDEKLSILGDRNSYSKTDKDATFMRMKVCVSARHIRPKDRFNSFITVGSANANIISLSHVRKSEGSF